VSTTILRANPKLETRWNGTRARLLWNPNWNNRNATGERSALAKEYLRGI